MSKKSEWALPEVVHPATSRCFKVYIPNDIGYIAAFYGAMWQMAQWYSWQVDPGRTRDEVADVMRAVFDRMLNDTCDCSGAAGGADSEDNLIRQNPDNPCLLETSINGTDWCAFADLSLCQNFGQQPGTGAGQPPSGGGTQLTCSALPANGVLLLPTLVNAGDTIELQGASGAGNDPGDPAGSWRWRVPNGNAFFGGLDIGLPVNDATDPLPATNHMAIIAAYGSGPSYLALPIGTPVTIPGGVSNAQIWLQVNDADLTDNNGGYQVCAQVTNNQATRWTHTFDFKAGTWGFSPTDGVTTWQPGVGFVGAFNPGQGLVTCRAIFTFAGTFTLDGPQAITYIDTDAYSNDLGTLSLRNGATHIFDSPAQVGNHGSFTGTVAANASGTGNTIVLGNDAYTGATMTVESIVLSGIGTDPFA